MQYFAAEEGRGLFVNWEGFAREWVRETTWVNSEAVSIEKRVPSSQFPASWTPSPVGKMKKRGSSRGDETLHNRILRASLP
jgi:hypothetical protein